MKKLWFLLVAFALFLTACSTNNLEIRGEEKLEIGFEYEYKVYLNGIEIDYSEYYFNVSNPEIAEIDENKIKALDSGFITLTVALKDNPSVYVYKQLEIIEPVVKSLKLRTDKTLNEGEQTIVEAFTDPEDTLEPVYFVSSNPSIATVDNDGVVTGIKGGIVTIYATCASAKAQIDIEIIEIIREIKVYGNNEIEVNSTESYNFNIKDPIITTDSTNICIQNNTVYALESGKAVLHIVSESNPDLELDYEITIVNDLENLYELSDEQKAELTSIMDSLTVAQKLGQMIVLDFRSNSLQLDENGVFFTSSSSGTTIRTNYLRDIITIPVGNINVTYYNSTNKNSLNNYIIGVQDLIMEDAGIGAIVLSDRTSYVSEGLTSGFTGRNNNILFGTADDSLLLEKYYDIVSDEMKLMGINTVVYSAYSRSASAIVENYSDINNKQILYSSITKNEFDQDKVNLGIYLNQVNFENEIFYENQDLLKTAINDDVDFIMVQNSRTFYGNKQISAREYLKSIGYNGLIMSSTSDFNNIYNNIGGSNTQAIKFCIESGIDLIPLSLYTSSYQIDNNPYIISSFNNVVQKIEEGEIDINLVNAAVERILTYKMKHGLINGVYPESIEFEGNNEILNDAESSLKLISKTGEFEGLDKNKNIHVISTRPDNGSWRNPVYYDLGNELIKNKDKYGYAEIQSFIIKESSFLENFPSFLENINEGDQVVVATYEKEFWFRYYDEEGNEEWAGYTWKDIISEIAKKTDNIVICNISYPSDTIGLEEYPIIYMNDHFDSKFETLLEVLSNGRCNGSSYYE